MPRSNFAVVYPLLVAACLLTAVTNSGCRKPDQIERHVVPATPREVAQPTLEPTDRMLAAMMTHGNKAWFFKVVGPLQQVAKLRPEVLDFLKSVRFDDGADAKPKWDLPKDWQREPPSDMRFATLKTGPDSSHLELVVTPLEMTGADLDRYLLINVNRWRGQMGLEPMGPFQLASAVEQFDAAGKTVRLVEIVGRHKSGRMTGGMREAPLDDVHAGLRRRSDPPRSTQSGQGFDPNLMTCTAPDHWKPEPIRGMRKANYSVEADGKKTEITVISAGGDMLGNVNRWRNQIQLANITSAELETLMTPINAQGVTGRYVELFGPQDAENREAIIAAVIPVGRVQWFVKLRGDAALAEREKSHFKQFVESLEFKSR